ncbi:MAG: hypothetical protein Q4A69_02090 [Moraxella sp.]|nr:hypothetical protein [Moraxella sp.]
MEYLKSSLVLIFTFSVVAHADLPLTVEDLLADKNRFKLDTNLSYYNHHKVAATAQDFDSIDVGNGRIIYIPSVGNSHSNTDSLIAGLGLRYGVSDKFELGIKTSGIYNAARHQNANHFTNTSDTYLQDVSITSQYQATQNHQSLPDSLIFGEVSVYDNTQGLRSKSGASAVIGGTVYVVNDPIVLSLTGSYQYQAKRDLKNGGQVAIGDTAMLNGSVGFAVNPDITLTGGVGVRHKWADKSSTKLENNNTQTTLNLGFAYAMSARTNLTTNVRMPISGDGGSTLSVGLTTKLGELPPPLSQKYRQNKTPEPAAP